LLWLKERDFWPPLVMGPLEVRERRVAGIFLFIIRSGIGAVVRREDMIVWEWLLCVVLRGGGPFGEDGG
jgi:hypothetical protein